MIKRVPPFLSGTLGEVTAGVSGTWGPWKEVTRQLETLLSGPMLPKGFYAAEALGGLLSPRMFSWLFQPSQ